MKYGTLPIVEDFRHGSYSKDQVVKALLDKCYIDSLPVNVIKIAQFLGFTLGELEMKDHLLSCIVDTSEEFCNGSKRVILVNKNLQDFDKIFAVAYELGAFCFHCNSQDDFYDRYFTCSVKGLSKTNHKEVNESEYFARCLLLPQDAVINYYTHYKLKKALGYKSNCSCIEYLCKVFNAPEEIVRSRVEELILE